MQAELIRANYGDYRTFRQAKRKQVDSLLANVRVLKSELSNDPIVDIEIVEAELALETLRERMTQKSWGK